MSRQPQARAGKAKYRIDAYYDLKERSRVNLEERNIKLEVIRATSAARFSKPEASARLLATRLYCRDFNYTFARYDRMGIIGPNGVGKSTFVKLLQGLIPPRQRQLGHRHHRALRLL